MLTGIVKSGGLQPVSVTNTTGESGINVPLSGWSVRTVARVSCDQIVLEGVEASEATELAGALQRAVDAANRAGVDAPNQPENVTQGEADSIAAISRSASRKTRSRSLR